MEKIEKQERAGEERIPNEGEHHCFPPVVDGCGASKDYQRVQEPRGINFELFCVGGN